MTEDVPIKKYPTTTLEVAKMLGLKGGAEGMPLGTIEKSADLPVPNLPVAESPAHSAQSSHSDISHNQIDADVKPAAAMWLKVTKAVGPYVVVFFVGLFLYYFFFTGVNFGAMFKSVPTPSTPKESALQNLEKQGLTGYQNWIASYYYDVSDVKVIEPDADNSGNGLSNFQKYLLNLNPKSYDTLSLGKPDSETLAEGINPLTGSPLTDSQKAVLDKYIDMEVVMNRLALSNLQHPQPAATSFSYQSTTNGAVAGASTNYNGQTFNTQQTTQQNTYTAPAQNSATTGIRGMSAPVTGANLSPTMDSNVDINTDIPGRLEIPSLKINVPVIWSKDTNSFEKDLQSGVVHYPGTALPGQIGTSYIAGHSSNYPWAKGSYNRVFATLGNLADNTSFKITVVSKTGTDVIFNYVVTRRQEYLPTDQAQFANTGDSLVALSTCWPVNTTAKRLVVFGKLTQVVR